MAIYVDALVDWGWKMRGRKVDSCHMFTDSADLEELHVFAEKIGMKRAWFQPHRIAPHYDLVPKRRAHALALGAIEVDRKEASAIWAARRALIGDSIVIRRARSSTLDHPESPVIEPKESS